MSKEEPNKKLKDYGEFLKTHYPHHDPPIDSLIALEELTKEEPQTDEKKVEEDLS